MEARENSCIFRNPGDLDDPGNASYVCEGPDGDWINPGKWADRLKVLATGTPEEIETLYRDEYYRRLVKNLNIGPDALNEPRVTDDMMPTPFPERRPMIDADEAMAAMRGMKKEIMRLTREKQLLALDAAKMGCPEGTSCSLAVHPPKLRPTSHCMMCWLKYAEDTIVKPGRQKIVPGTKNA